MWCDWALESCACIWLWHWLWQASKQERSRWWIICFNLPRSPSFATENCRKLWPIIFGFFFFLKFCSFCWEWIGYQTCAGTKKSLNNFVRFEISWEMAEEKNWNGESKNVFWIPLMQKCFIFGHKFLFRWVKIINNWCCEAYNKLSYYEHCQFSSFYNLKIQFNSAVIYSLNFWKKTFSMLVAIQCKI